MRVPVCAYAVKLSPKFSNRIVSVYGTDYHNIELNPKLITLLQSFDGTQESLWNLLQMQEQY